jgi:PBP1b-binding outer membrane lipoprotein LpoB
VKRYLLLTFLLIIFLTSCSNKKGHEPEVTQVTRDASLTIDNNMINISVPDKYRVTTSRSEIEIYTYSDKIKVATVSLLLSSGMNILKSVGKVSTDGDWKYSSDGDTTYYSKKYNKDYTIYVSTIEKDFMPILKLIN